MNCGEISEILIDYINQDLTPEEMTLVEEHINSCPVCYSEYQFLQQICACCQEPVEYHEIYIEEFVYEVRSKIEKQRKVKSFVKFLPLAAIPLALVAFLLLKQPGKQKHVPVYIDNETRYMVDSLSEDQFEFLIEKIKQVTFTEE